MERRVGQRHHRPGPPAFGQKLLDQLEARDLVRRRKFDIVLVDLYMSQVSGLELLRAALEEHRDTIVVVMTGNPSVTSSIEALRAGAWDYLPKPFSATHLQF
jgi:DNA-binding NtrC family response regulator